METKLNIEELRKFVVEKHGSQTRMQGTPYYLHPFAVADKLKEKGYDEKYQIAGLFHDLLEDTDTMYEELIYISNSEIAYAVKLVTKENGYIMEDYIKRISENEIAKMVKLADRLHNLKESNLAGEAFIRKYIEETKQWYIELAKGTCFEKELQEIVEELESKLPK